jgi:hypothetical protein
MTLLIQIIIVTITAAGVEFTCIAATCIVQCMYMHTQLVLLLIDLAKEKETSGLGLLIIHA